MSLTKIDHKPRTTEEAVKIVRSAPANSRFYIHVQGDAPIHDDPDKCYRAGFFATVHVSRDVAERFITDAFRPHLVRNGCYMPIAEHVGEQRERYNTKSMEREKYGQPVRYFYLA